MKKFAGVMIVLAALVIAGCSSTAPAAGGDSAPTRDAPPWFLNPPVAEDALYGVGVAKMQTEGASITFADNRARASLAEGINSRVQGMITDYMSGSEGSNQAMANFQESVRRTLTDATLSGAIVKERYMSRDGTCYSLVSIPKNVAQQQAVARLGENPNRALAQRALRDMDRAFNTADYNTAPTPVTE